MTAIARGKTTQRKWDRASRNYDLFTFGDDLRLGPDKRRLFQKVSGSTLMVAAGTGNDFKYFPPGLTLTAIDISPEMLEKAKAKAVAYSGMIELREVRNVVKGSRLRFSGWTLDTSRRQLTAPDGVLVELSGGEYELLVAFLERPQIVLNRDQLLDITRGRFAGPFDRAIDMQVGRLRRKIEADPRNPTLIKTVRGGGYVFASQVEGR